MATTANINVNLNTTGNAEKNIGEVVNATKSLRTQLQEMRNELNNLDEGSARFKELSIEAGKLRDQIKDTQDVINATAGTAVENLGTALNGVSQLGIAGFQGIMSAQALFGQESENLQKTLVKLQAVAGLSDAIKTFGGLGDTLTQIKASALAAAQSMGIMTTATIAETTATEGATVAQEGLNTAMKLSPIGLIIAGITVLIGALALFSSNSESVKEKTERLNKEQEKLNETLDKTVDSVNKLNESYAKYRQEANMTGVLKTQRELLQTEDKLNDIIRSRPNDYKSIIEVQKQINALNIKIAEDEKKAKIEAFREETRLLESRLENINTERENIRKSERANTEAAQARLNTLFDEAETLRLTLQTRQKNLITQEEGVELQNLTLELDNNILKARIDAGNKIADLNQKIKEQELEAIKAIDDASKESYQKNQERAEEAINRRFNEQVEAAKKELDLIDVNSKKRLEAEEKYNQAVKNFTIEREKSLLQLQSEIRKNSLLKLETEINDLKRKLLKAQNIEAISLAIQLQQKQKELLLLQMEEELKAVDLTEEQKLKIKSEYALKIAELEKDFRDKSQKDSIDSTEKSLDKQKLTWDDYIKDLSKRWKENWSETLSGIVDMAAGMISSITQSISNIIEISSQKASFEREDRYRREMENYQLMLDQQLISREEYDTKISLLNQQKEQEERVAKGKAFKQQKAFNLVNAIMSTAEAIAEALPNPILAALAGVLGATQIGVISSQQFTAAKGGIVPGNGPGNIDSVPSLLAPGEAVINSNSTAMFGDLLSAINEMGGGVSLVPNTPFGGTSMVKNSVFAENDRAPIRAYVVESEMTDRQRRVSRIERTASFG